MARNTPLTVEIEEGELRIRIGLGPLAHSARMHPELHEWDPDKLEDKGPLVSNGKVFAEEVRTVLLGESETGRTRVTDMLDAAILEAYENGAAGILSPEQVAALVADWDAS